MSEKPIQRRRFFGWQRIGIVLSVLWIIGTFAYALNQQSEDAAFFHSICIKGGKTSMNAGRKVGYSAKYRGSGK